MSEVRIPSKPILIIRSAVYWVLSILWLAIVVSTTTFAFPFSVHVRYRIISNWAKGSINLLKELRSYKWKQDKNGIILDEPVDAYNHVLDGGSYAIYNEEKDYSIIIL